MSKDTPHDKKAGGEEESNIYYCRACGEEYPKPGEPLMCPKCAQPLTNKSAVDPAEKPIVD